MSTITDNLDKIRGWHPVTGNPYIDRRYDVNYYPYAVVRDAIVYCLSDLASRYEVLLGDEINIIESATWMPSVKQAIYDACVKIANKLAINPFVELGKIKAAHFGSELREPIYDIFVKFGILDDPYRPTSPADYIYRVDNDEVTLLYYIGTPREFIIIPSALTIEEVDYPIKYLEQTLFNENPTIKGVKIPESVEVIS